MFCFAPPNYGQQKKTTAGVEIKSIFGGQKWGGSGIITQQRGGSLKKQKKTNTSNFKPVGWTVPQAFFKLFFYILNFKRQKNTQSRILTKIVPNFCESFFGLIWKTPNAARLADHHGGN